MDGNVSFKYILVFILKVLNDILKFIDYLIVTLFYFFTTVSVLCVKNVNHTGEVCRSWSYRVLYEPLVPAAGSSSST